MRDFINLFEETDVDLTTFYIEALIYYLNVEARQSKTVATSFPQLDDDSLANAYFATKRKLNTETISYEEFVSFCKKKGHKIFG